MIQRKRNLANRKFPLIVKEYLLFSWPINKLISLFSRLHTAQLKYVYSNLGLDEFIDALTMTEQPQNRSQKNHPQS